MANDKSYITLTEENFQKEVIESNQPRLGGLLGSLVRPLSGPWPHRRRTRGRTRRAGKGRQAELDANHR